MSITVVPSAPTRERLVGLVPYLLLSALVLTVFIKVVHFDLVWLDDNILVTTSHYFTKELSNIPQAFSQDAILSGGAYSTYYRPLQIISLIIDAQFCGIAPGCFHISNLVLHLFFVLTLFYFLRVVQVGKWPAFFLTALFAVHPAIAANVGWIPGRTYSLLGVFFLFAFIFFIQWITKRRDRYLILHLLFFNLALYSSELAFVLAPLILYWYLAVNKEAAPRKLETYVLPAWIVSIGLWLMLRSTVAWHSGVTLADQLSLHYLPGVLIYLGRIPVNLSVFPTIQDGSLIPGIAVVAILALLLYLGRRQWRNITFGYVWLLVLLLPAITQGGPKTVPVFYEHRLYLPLVGLCISLGHFIPAKIKDTQLLVAACLVLVFLFSTLTYNRIDTYKNPISFWQQAIVHSPHSAEAFQGLGFAYRFYAHDVDTALPMYKKALALDPNIPFAHANLGSLYLQQGKYDEAEAEILTELKMQDNDFAWLQLGRVYYAEGHPDKALAAWQRAYLLNPDYLSVNIDLALVYVDMGQYAQAKKYYQRALELGGLESDDKQYLEKLAPVLGP